MTLQEREQQHLQNVLEKTHWNLHTASRLLQISVHQLEQKMKDYHIESPDTEDNSSEKM